MAKEKKPTRSELREQRAAVPEEGVYGVDVEDAGAASWIGRYVIWAASPDEAAARVRSAGFHKKQIERRWTPKKPPPGGVPAALTGDCHDWYRSRLDDDGWTEWERLPPEYRHPSQALAAENPDLR
jgi:hypothetical protein